MTSTRPRERASPHAFVGVAALLFAGSAVATIRWRASMAAAGDMPWMRMPGQTWIGAAGVFLGTWVPMMVAMMLPSATPMLWRYRQAVGASGVTRLGWLTTVVGAAYFAVWTVSGVAVFPLGVAARAIAMHHPAVARAGPMTVAVVVLLAGALQFTTWKTRRLACCRDTPGHRHALAADLGTAWRYGLRLGRHCCHCCAGHMLVLLVIGVMDLRAMAAVTAAITIERLAPARARGAHVTGVAAVGAGFCLIARAAGII